MMVSRVLAVRTSRTQANEFWMEVHSDQHVDTGQTMPIDNFAGDEGICKNSGCRKRNEMTN